MSDLISRSELLKAMDTWDKFGYDEHNRLIKIDRTNEEYVPYVHYEDMVKCVNDMQTAYSVGNVVEELELLKIRYFLTIANTGDEKSDFAYENVGNALDKAIEIVKQGGISDDVCEWKQTSTARYKTSCGYKLEEYFDTNACYCKQCGKKIKVVE